MHLSKRKVPSASYQHYFGEKGLPPQVGNLDELVTRLRQGDLSVVNTIVEHHMGLAMSVVGRYVYRTGPHMADDLVSVAMLQLTRTTRRAMTELRDNNITPYLVSALHSALSRFIAEDTQIRVPYSTYRKNRPKLPVVASLTDDLAADKTQLTDRKEAIDACCKNSTEREIVRLRLQGYVDTEIAVIIGSSKSTVAKTRQEIAKRYADLEKE